MSKATFDHIRDDGRGVCMEFTLEPRYKGCKRVDLSQLADGRTALLAVGDGGGPVPELDDGSDGILFQSETHMEATEALAQIGYEAVGMPKTVKRRISFSVEQTGTTADSRQAILNRLVSKLIEEWKDAPISIELVE